MSIVDKVIYERHGSRGFEQRFAYDASLSAEYVGYAENGTATSAARWSIIKYEYDGNGLVTRSQILFNVIWDDRVTLSWS